MADAQDLMASIVTAKPVEFDKTFTGIVQDRIVDLIADRKIEVAKTFFSPPTPEEVDDNEISNENPVDPDTSEDPDTENTPEEDSSEEE